ncbi:hypothetical protein FQN54_003059 [Arachnomyces sp. PD_36]|nr:hypothetical protein FQN54_003059 [Arachnomyces sp. PD_36]
MAPLDFEPYVLSPLDHAFGAGDLGSYQTPLVTFTLNDPGSAIPALQTGVFRLLKRLPFLTGELFSTGHKGQVGVRPSSSYSLEKSPMLVVRRHARRLPPVQRIGIQTDEANYDDTYVRLPLLLCDPLKPILRIQVNILQNGIILALSFNHMVFDGVGMNQIISALAQCCRSTEVPPVCVEQQDAGRKLISQQVATTDSAGNPLDGYGTYGFPQDELPTGTKPLSRVRVSMSPTKVQRLKNICNRQLPKLRKHYNNRAVSVISTSDVLNALIWLSVSKASALEGDAIPNLRFPINIRPKIQPPLPHSYLGVALLSATLPYTQSTTSNEVLELARTAFLMRQMVLDVGSETVRTLITKMHEASNWSEFGQKVEGLWVSNLSFCTIYRSDFGPSLGRPSDLDLALQQRHDTAYLMPKRVTWGPNVSFSEREMAPWDVILGLEPAAANRLKDHPILRWATELGSQRHDQNFLNMTVLSILPIEIDFKPILQTPFHRTTRAKDWTYYETFCLTFEVADIKKAISMLETGVARLLESLPFLAGELAVNGVQWAVVPPSIDSFEKIPMLSVCQHSRSLPWLSWAGSPVENKLLAVLDETYVPIRDLHFDSFRPVFRLRANVLQGGIVLAVSYNHMVLDGIAVNQVLEVLASYCKKSNSRSVALPTNMEQQIATRRINSNAASGARPTDDLSAQYETQPGKVCDIGSQLSSNVACIEFNVTQAKLRLLKSACNQQLGDFKSSPLSSNDILSALIWMCVIRADSDDATKTVSSIGVTTDLRRRMQTPVPQPFLGVAILEARVQYDLLEMEQFLCAISANDERLPDQCTALISKMAMQIRRRVETLDNQYMNNVIATIQEDEEHLEPGPNTSDLVISNLSRMNAYQLDFGHLGIS